MKRLPVCVCVLDHKHILHSGRRHFGDKKGLFQRTVLYHSILAWVCLCAHLYAMSTNSPPFPCRRQQNCTHVRMHRRYASRNAFGVLFLYFESTSLLYGTPSWAANGTNGYLSNGPIVASKLPYGGGISSCCVQAHLMDSLYPPPPLPHRSSLLSRSFIHKI